MIEMFYPHIPKEAIDEVVNTLYSRWVGQGPKVDIFEQDFSKLFKQKYCVALNSGTSALETAYDLLELKEGDEVITTPLTCTATNLPLLSRKVKIVFADVKEDTLTLNREDVLSKITNKTKAVVNVHLGGIESEIGKMHVPIIDDSCQALGIFKGDYTCCSFQAIKHITTGDGGMLVVPTDEKYKKAKLLRWFGIDREKKIKNNWQCYKERQMTFTIDMIGYKRQMTDIDASLGIVGLKHYNEYISHRKKIFDIYKKELKNIDGIKLIDGEHNVYWLCTVLVERRDDFAKMLFENHVDTNMVQLRNDIYPIFGGKRQELPIMNKVENKYLSIPLHMRVSEEDAYYITNIIKKGW